MITIRLIPWVMRTTKWLPRIIRSSANISYGSIMTIKYLCLFDSLIPGRFECYFRLMSLKLNLVIDGWGFFCETALRWMSLDLTDDKSTLVQVMAWCHQATSHYMSQCWLRSLSPYGITRPEWVNTELWNGIKYIYVSLTHWSQGDLSDILD